jgi:CheY-like chemotaxis protein
MTRVLLVDDEPEVLEAWTFVLDYAGYDVDQARDGREALARVQRQLPDVLVTDLMMPGVDGAELCNAMRSNPDWAHIPIVLHTSAHVPATSALWNSVLRKPARLELLLAALAQLAES